MKNPRYIADYGEKAFHVLDRETQEVQKVSLEELCDFKWLTNGGVGNLAIETAHIRVSFFEDDEGNRFKKSKAQPFNDEEQIKDFFANCKERGIELKGLPEKSIWGFRKIYFPDEDKGDVVDLKTWDKAIEEKSSNWDVAHKAENMEFHDSKRTINPKEHTVYTAGKEYQDRLKLAACIISASGEWKEGKPAKEAFSVGCIEAVTSRLYAHTSDNGKIKDGVASIVIGGEEVTLSLLDIMGFERNAKDTAWKKTSKPVQFISCMMLLVDANGERYKNVLTGKPVGFKMIKQYGMVSSAFHMKPGFLRPKFYYHGTKSMSRKLFKDIFGIEKYSFSKMDYNNSEHLKLKNFIMTTCRIAYEQTTKAMKSYLNEKNDLKGLEKFAA